MIPSSYYNDQTVSESPKKPDKKPIFELKARPVPLLSVK